MAFCCSDIPDNNHSNSSLAADGLFIILAAWLGPKCPIPWFMSRSIDPCQSQTTSPGRVLQLCNTRIRYPPERHHDRKSMYFFTVLILSGSRGTKRAITNRTVFTATPAAHRVQTQPVSRAMHTWERPRAALQHHLCTHPQPVLGRGMVGEPIAEWIASTPRPAPPSPRNDRCQRPLDRESATSTWPAEQLPSPGLRRSPTPHRSSFRLSTRDGMSWSRPTNPRPHA